MDAGVPQALPREPPICQTALRPAVEALHHSPQPLVDPLLPLRALHVDTVLHREHIRRVIPALQPPPGDDVAHLQRLEEPEYARARDGPITAKKILFKSTIFQKEFFKMTLRGEGAVILDNQYINARAI